MWATRRRRRALTAEYAREPAPRFVTAAENPGRPPEANAPSVG